MKNRSFHIRLGFALLGLREGWKRERSFRTQVLIGVLVIMTVIAMDASALWLAVIGLAIAAVLAAEMFNAALEALVDHLHPDIHPEIRVVKDMAAAAVLLVSMGAAIAGMVFLGAYFWR